MRLLLVEDSTALRESLAIALAAEGHAVDAAADGSQALGFLAHYDYDLMVLDLALPGIDGLGVLDGLRAQRRATRVLVLSARDQVSDRVEALNRGADDYLVKPFALSELVARIEAVLRRSQGSRRRQLQVGDLVYDLDTLAVSRGGVPIRLNPIGHKLLAILMQRSPAVVRREALEEALWGDNVPDSDSLRSHIHQLRQALDKPFERPLLHTVHGVGFRLAEQSDAR
ncbi:MAG TPA: DNA-binding response regulator [Pseudomonas sp.]|nr:DNA-binding response regulator [Pseudomonas sp.]